MIHTKQSLTLLLACVASSVSALKCKNTTWLTGDDAGTLKYPTPSVTCPTDETYCMLHYTYDQAISRANGMTHTKEHDIGAYYSCATEAQCTAKNAKDTCVKDGKDAYW